MKILFLLLLFSVSVMAQAPHRSDLPEREIPQRRSFVLENYSSGDRTFAPDALMRLKGSGFVYTFASGSAVDPPTMLADCRVTVDGQPARIRYVSPSEIQIIGPPVSRERVEVVVETPLGIWREQFEAARTSPGLFKAHSDSPQQWAAGWFRVGSNLPVFLGDTIVPLPNANTQVVIALMGSGWRHASRVDVIIGTRSVPVRGFAPFVGVAGFDTLNFELPSDFSDSGVVQCFVIADGLVSNSVWIRF